MASSSAKQPLSGMERKQKQRDLEEARKERLMQLLQVLMPGDTVLKSARKRRLICTNGLLQDAARCVKYLKHTALSDYRGGMMRSRACGTILLRRQDLHVVESNLGMELFSPFAPFKGYCGQSLRIVTHAADGEELAAAVKRAQVGQVVTVRLVRMCFEESSGCLLSKYVRKELKVSHASPDGKTVLLTCVLTASDTAPLTTSPEFFEEFFKFAEEHCRGPCKVVCGSNVLESLDWMQERMVVVDPIGTDSLVQTLWSLSQGYASIMAQVMVEAIRMYMWVGKDRAGRPVFQTATCMQHGTLKTKWHHFLCAGCSGEPIAVPSPPNKRTSCIHTLLLPEDGGFNPWKVARTIMLVGGTQLEGLFTCVHREQHSEVGHHLGGGGRRLCASRFTGATRSRRPTWRRRWMPTRRGVLTSSTCRM